MVKVGREAGSKKLIALAAWQLAERERSEPSVSKTFPPLFLMGVMCVTYFGFGVIPYVSPISATLSPHNFYVHGT